jgi:hypothetical protein
MVIGAAAAETVPPLFCQTNRQIQGTVTSSSSNCRRALPGIGNLRLGPRDASVTVYCLLFALRLHPGYVRNHYILAPKSSLHFRLHNPVSDNRKQVQLLGSSWAF